MIGFLIGFVLSMLLIGAIASMKLFIELSNN